MPQGLQVSGDDVEVVLRLPGLRILDLCKVSERLPCDGPGPPNEARSPSLTCPSFGLIHGLLRVYSACPTTCPMCGGVCYMHSVYGAWA